MASVSKRKWKHNQEEKEAWVVRYVDQSGKRRMKTFEKKKEADAYRFKIEREINDGIHTPDRCTLTMKDTVDEYLRDCDRRRKVGDRMAGGTLYGYKIIAEKHIVHSFGARRINQINSLEIQDFVNEKGLKYARRTVTRIVLVLRNVLTFAVSRGWLKRNPMADQPPRVPGATPERIEIPTKEELRSILEYLSVRRANEHHMAHYRRIVMVMLGLFAGMRRGEICGLTWENIDFDKNVILVRHSYSVIDGLKAPKSRAGVRDIPMAAPVRAALLQLQVELGEGATGLVMKTNRGTPLKPDDMYYWYWRPLCIAAGLVSEDGGAKYHFHALRHAAVSLLIEQGLPPLHIKRIVGHASISLTMDTYGHLFPEDDAARHAVDRAASLLSGARAQQISVSN
ncbi:site-specific integrase [Azospirillum sp. A26]|uniref:tyrosine-type recombinase/integrase n=1 Tax=Azospirillum sp. A26 TaxID=3160607 RepID=UPI003670C187